MKFTRPSGQLDMAIFKEYDKTMEKSCKDHISGTFIKTMPPSLQISSSLKVFEIVYPHGCRFPDTKDES